MFKRLGTRVLGQKIASWQKKQPAPLLEVKCVFGLAARGPHVGISRVQTVADQAALEILQDSPATYFAAFVHLIGCAPIVIDLQPLSIL